MFELWARCGQSWGCKFCATHSMNKKKKQVKFPYRKLYPSVVQRRGWRGRCGRARKKWQLHWCYYLCCQQFAKVNKQNWQADNWGGKATTWRHTPRPPTTIFQLLQLLLHAHIHICIYVYRYTIYACRFACSKLLLCFWILRIILQFAFCCFSCCKRHLEYVTHTPCAPVLACKCVCTF